MLFFYLLHLHPILWRKKKKHMKDNEIRPKVTGKVHGVVTVQTSVICPGQC